MYKKGHIHFVGIGGIGMSGIAKILRKEGYTISGCDKNLEQKSIKELIQYGCSIYEGNNTGECHDHSIKIVVYSSAISPNNEEILFFQSQGIPTIPRALMLAEIMRTKYSIAISGAHGKTTTTSLLSHILIESLFDPTVIIGGHLKNIGSNARSGEGKFLVAEADESDRSFLKLHPTLAIVTNIDLEHLETYKDIDDIKAAFTQFLSNIPFYGKAILCREDSHVRALLPLLTHIKTITYGFDQQSDLYAQDIVLNDTNSVCTVCQKNTQDPLGTLVVPMPGKHNILNALAALAAALDIGLSFEVCAQALRSFQGVERRFTFRGTFQGAEVIDDYAHHPTEITATLLTALHKKPRKLIAVWQPHRYIRTKELWTTFIDLFLKSRLDQLIITDIYSAGERPIEGISSSRFVEELVHKKASYPVYYVPYSSSATELISHLSSTVEPQDLILLLGAGSITKVAGLLTTQEQMALGRPEDYSQSLII